MGRAPALVLQLELDTSDDPITGRISAGAGLVVPFAGWVGLAAALEQAMSAGRGARPPETGRGER